MPRGSPGPRWFARVAVLSAFAATLYLAGPRASRALAARLSGAARRSALVDLDRVAFLETPGWMPKRALLALAKDLHPVLSGRVPILDEEAGEQLLRSLRSVPWVRDVGLDRRFPDRLEARLSIRRPRLCIADRAGEPIRLCDGEGIALRFVDGFSLPIVRVDRSLVDRCEEGLPIASAVVQAALGVVLEWQDALAPRVRGCPRLLEVDAERVEADLPEDPRHPEISVVLERSGGGEVVFGYGRPPSSKAPRVPVEDKARTLSAILERHEGLKGIERGDLRFGVRWQDWLEPRLGPDPAGPWTTR
ncbi:MAG: hypothetical protein Fur0037_16720 [Planctomycetota bacterium]